MSRWTHYVCESCWASRFDRGHDPVRMNAPATAPCCKCGKTHASGIYVREDPAHMFCMGKHDEYAGGGVTMIPSGDDR